MYRRVSTVNKEESMMTFASQWTKVFGLLLLLTPLFACRQSRTNKIDEFYTERVNGILAGYLILSRMKL